MNLTIPGQAMQACPSEEMPTYSLYEKMKTQPPITQQGAGLIRIGEENLVRIVIFLKEADKTKLYENFCMLSQASKYFFVFSRTLPAANLEGLYMLDKTNLVACQFLQPFINVAAAFYEKGRANWHNAKLREDGLPEIDVVPIDAKIKENGIVFCDSIALRSENPYEKIVHLRKTTAIFDRLNKSGFFGEFSMLNKAVMNPFFLEQVQGVFNELLRVEIEKCHKVFGDFYFSAGSSLPWDVFSERCEYLVFAKIKLCQAVDPALSSEITKIDCEKALRNGVIEKFSTENLKFIGGKFLTSSYCKERKETYISGMKEMCLRSLNVCNSAISEQNLYAAEDLYDEQCRLFQEQYKLLDQLRQTDTYLPSVLDKIHSKAAKFFLELAIPMTEENGVERAQKLSDIIAS